MNVSGVEEEMDFTITELSDFAPPYLFVYGTLMRGEGNSNVMPSGSKFVGEAQTEEGYELLDVGLPALREGGQGVVIGELYEVNDSILRRLDLFEGHPSFYRRDRIRLRGAVSEAWCYFRNPSHGKALPSPASWRRRKEA